MPERDKEINTLDAQLQRSYWAEPTHLEATGIVADEVNKLAQHPTMLETPHVIEYMKPNIIGEVVEETNELQQPTKEIHVSAHNTQIVKGDLEPFGYRVLEMRGGRRLEGGIIASVAYDTDGGRCELIRDEKGNTGMASITGEGKVVRSTDIKGYDTKLRAGLGYVYVIHQPKADDKWTIEYQSDHENKVGGQLSVAENVSIQSRLEAAKEYREKEKREKRIKWLKRAVGAGALYLTFVPGGMIDSVADQFVTSEQTVQASLETFKPDFYTMDSELDGISMKEFDNPAAFLAEQNSELQTEWERAQTAGQAVETSMDNLDDHNYQAILDQAAEYRETHSEEFIDSEIAGEIFTELNDATTKEQALTALKKLGDFYGYTFHVSEEVPLDALKNTASEVADGLIVLPKGFTDQAVLKAIYFETTEEINEGRDQADGSSTQAFYSSSTESIHMSSLNAPLSVGKDILSTIPGTSAGFDAQAIFLHEFGHALSDGQSRVGIPDFDQISDPTAPLTIAKDIIMGGVLSSPQVISSYARTNAEESTAENLSGVLSDRNDGLAHPDNVRQFTSPSNQKLLENLISLEISNPGFANYLIAQNDTLMHGQILGIE